MREYALMTWKTMVMTMLVVVVTVLSRAVTCFFISFHFLSLASPKAAGSHRRLLYSIPGFIYICGRKTQVVAAATATAPESELSQSEERLAGDFIW